MKKVFVTRKILESGPDLLRSKGFQVTISSKDIPLSRYELMEAAKNADALITNLSDPIDREFLFANSHLKIITNYAVGLNNIDLKTAQELGIKIGNTPDVLTEATAEIAFGLMIAASRNFKSAMMNAQLGEWRDFEPQGHLGHALHGKKLGIVGYGRIGKRLGEMAAGAFKMEVVGYKRGEDLVEFLSGIDVLSIHLPLTSETKNFIGKKELSALKKSAILINTARGDVIDQEALYLTLKNKEIFAAGLDVTTPEPLAPTHPLLALPNVMILPHIGSATFEARSDMSMMCAENILQAFSEK